MLTPKGRKIKRRLKDFYGKEKGEEVFRLMIEEKKLVGVEIKKKKK